MLKGVPAILSPALLKVLCEMGHGDEIVIADGNFPAENMGTEAIVIRADGHGVPEILDAVLRMIPLDQYVEQPAALMQVVPGDPCVPEIWDTYRTLLNKNGENPQNVEMMERFAFYERAKKAYAIVATGETAIYANILLKKGVAITGDDYRYTTQYEFTRLNDIKPEMIEEATVAARNAAEKFAKDSDSKLGKIRRANQGQFVISDRDNNTPYIKQVRVVTTIDYYLKD